MVGSNNHFDLVKKMDTEPNEDGDAKYGSGSFFAFEGDLDKARKMELKARVARQPPRGQLPNPSECPQGRMLIGNSMLDVDTQFFDNAHSKAEAGEMESLLREENTILKARLNELAMSQDTSLRAENEALRQDNQRLESEVQRLMAANGSSRGSPKEHSEGRLREAMTKQGTTTSELRQAIKAVEALMDEARRELGNAQLRERRAAFEALYHAIDHSDDEIVLEEAIEKARLADVEIEDIQKGEAKLAAVRALTPEQKALKSARELESRNKKEAFLFIKRDDAEKLRALIEGLDEKVRWLEWRDYAGRSLWKCAVDLRATMAQGWLAPHFGQRLPEDNKANKRGERPSISLLGDGKRPSLGSPTNAPLSGSPLARQVSSGSSGSRAQRKSSGDVRDSPSFCPRSPGSPSGLQRLPGSPSGLQRLPNGDKASGDGLEAQRLSPESLEALPPAAFHLDGTRKLGEREVISNEGHANGNESAGMDLGRSETWKSCMDGSETPGDSVSPTRSDAEYAVLRAQAFRAVAQDDTDSLLDVLEQVHQDIWTLWMNKAGKDLITLSTERGSDLCYSTLARELGILREAAKEVFEERESVWIFENGEVQPKRATVLEDSPLEEESVLVEFWDGDEPAVRVDRGCIHKMFS